MSQDDGVLDVVGLVIEGERSLPLTDFPRQSEIQEEMNTSSTMHIGARA